MVSTPNYDREYQQAEENASQRPVPAHLGIFGKGGLGEGRRGGERAGDGGGCG